MKRLFAAALLLAATVAHADDWTFTLKNLRSDGIFGTTADLFTIGGSFSGQDNNRDGFITTDELTSVKVWDTYQAYPFRNVGLDETTRPYSTGFARIRFDIQAGRLDDFYAFSFDGAENHSMDLNGAYICSVICYGATFDSGSSIAVTAGTKTTQSLPVPEPETWALMALGLLTLSAGSRLRARG